MPKGFHEGQARRIREAKAALHPLPVVPNGVQPVIASSVEAIYEAALQFAKDSGGTIHIGHKAAAAASWISYRCTEFSACAIARMVRRNEGQTNRDIARVEANLRRGVGCEIVEGILRILVARGHCTQGVAGQAPFFVRPPPKPEPEEIVVPVADGTVLRNDFADPRWAEVKKWRARGFSVKRISKFTGIPTPDVAKMLGIEWGAG